MHILMIAVVSKTVKIDCTMLSLQALLVLQILNWLGFMRCHWLLLQLVLDCLDVTSVQSNNPQAVFNARL